MSGQDDETPVTPRDQSTAASGLTDAMRGLSIGAGESKDDSGLSVSPSGERQRHRNRRKLKDRAAVLRSRHKGMAGLQYKASPSEKDSDDQDRVQTNRMLGEAEKRRMQEQRMEEQAAAAQAKQNRKRPKRKRKLYSISRYSLTSQLGQPNIW